MSTLDGHYGLHPINVLMVCVHIANVLIKKRMFKVRMLSLSIRFWNELVESQKKDELHVRIKIVILMFKIIVARWTVCTLKLKYLEAGGDGRLQRYMEMRMTVSTKGRSERIRYNHNGG